MSVQQNSVNFGKIGHCILFGGGSLLAHLVKKLKQEGFSVFVVTSDRHADERIAVEAQSISLMEFLKKNRVDFTVAGDISTDAGVISRITDQTIGISFGAAWIFKKEFIDLFKGRLLNCHGSRLPENRGGGGFSWRILRGDRAGASVLHRIDPGIDTGDILFSEEYVFPDQCRLPADYQAYSIERYRKFFDRFFASIKAERSFTATPQQERSSSYWPRLVTDIHGYIDWSWSLQNIERHIRAFDDPYAGASTFVDGRKVRLKKVGLSSADGLFHPFQNGLIYRISENSVFVATKEGTLVIKTVLYEGGLEITDQLRVGERFHTPMQFLEEAKHFRAIYTPNGLKKENQAHAH